MVSIGDATVRSLVREPERQYALIMEKDNNFHNHCKPLAMFNGF